MSNSVIAINRKTGEKVKFVGVSPQWAVVSQFAAELGDNNSWDYDKYNPMVVENTNSFVCGNWFAMKEGIASQIAEQLGISESDVFDLIVFIVS